MGKHPNVWDMPQVANIALHRQDGKYYVVFYVGDETSSDDDIKDIMHPNMRYGLYDETVPIPEDKVKQILKILGESIDFGRRVI